MKNLVPLTLLIFFISCDNQSKEAGASKDSGSVQQKGAQQQQGPRLDTAKYNQLIAYISNGDTTGK